MSQGSTRAIALIHGLGGNRLIMRPLRRKLERKGYRVTNWGYASLRRSIELHAADFQKKVIELDENPEVDALHIVGHSMGNIVTRALLQAYRPAKLQRIVMICPPNRGSRLASFFSPLVGWLSHPIRQIADTPDSFVNLLSSKWENSVDIGIIRARHDLLVAAENTVLPGAAEFVEVRALHTSILFMAETADLVDRFLTHGTFEKTPETQIQVVGP